MNKIIFINSHPIQYFAPLYSYLNEQGLSVSCWYCSDENVSGHLDRQFGVHVGWDVPILQGYPFRFFKNQSWKPSIYNGFFGLFNPGMVSALFREPKSIIIVHGWAYFTHVLILVFARLCGHVVCVRGESPLNQELKKNKKTLLIKRLLLAGLLFRFVHKFLYIGKQNKAFYQYYGIKEKDLIFVPYAVDNTRFQQDAKRYQQDTIEIRRELRLPEKGEIILFAAKFIDKKRPLDLLSAFAKLNDGYCLVMVGDGELRPSMEEFIQRKELKNVFLTGFKNQSEIGKYYAVADVFVMCSGDGETWGLSVNEALNFHNPVVVTQITGCSSDLVLEGRNGFIAQDANPEDLAQKIIKALALPSYSEEEPLATFSFYTIAQSLTELQKISNEW